jgi:OFA family oxalate/formate antiporter-like MFS transporter
LVLAASVLMQVCLGGIYAWSTFVPPLRQGYGLSAAQTQLIFGVTIAMLTLGMVAAGRVEARRGPRPVAAAGAVLYALGYLLASRSHGVFPVLLLGLGIVGGLGIGTVYICPLATCVKWFPERKGLVTGLAVAGYGAGAIVLSALATALFQRGWGVLSVFQLIAVTYGSIVLLSALALSVPRAETIAPVPESLSIGWLLRQREFWALAAGMFSATFAGTLVIGNLKPLGLQAGIESGVATAAISALAIGNATGRLTWGGTHDRWGARVLPVSLVFLSGAVFSLLETERAPNGFLSFALLVGLGYGGALVLYAAQAAQVWGLARVGSIYPLVMLFHGAAALIGPGLAGYILDRTDSFNPALVLGGSTALVGAALVLVLGLTDHRRAKRMTDVSEEVLV